MASNYGYQTRFGPELTPLVRNLIIINVAIFLLQFISGTLLQRSFLEAIFALNPEKVSDFWIWQLLTYSFLHADFFHILFNMFSLWMFGSELESTWGSDIFLKAYLFAASLGGVLTYLAHFWWPQGIVLGASGGIYGLLVAFAMIWPNREILFMAIFPLKAKYFVLIIMLMLAFSGGGGHIAHFAHAGGALGGYLFVRYFEFFRNFGNWNFSISRSIQRRKMRKYQEEMDMRVNAKTRVDELLDKISKQGMNSLTRKEKKFLNEASTKYFNDKN